MRRRELILCCTLPLALAATAARAQDLGDRPQGPPPPASTPLPTDPNQVQFSADALEYDSKADVVTVTGDVRMFRQGNRLRADKVVWNRKTGKVVATGNIAVTNPQGDVAYGDSIELTDTLKDGVVQNMLVVLEQGGRLAAKQGTRQDNGTIDLDHAAYTPCDVTASNGCPKNPSWKITAVKVTYRPDKQRIYYMGAQFHLFGLSVPMPAFRADATSCSQLLAGPSVLGTEATPALLPMRTVSILLSQRARNFAGGNHTSRPMSRQISSVFSSNIRNVATGFPPRRWITSITSLWLSR